MKKYVVDTSVIIEKLVTKLIKEKKIKVWTVYQFVEQDIVWTNQK